MSPQCGLSQGHLPRRISPIWINLKPTTRSDQHNQILTYRPHLLSLSSHYCVGGTIEICFFFLSFFSMSQDKQKHWTIRQALVLWSRSTRACSTSCSHVNSNNSDVFPSLRETNLMIYTQTAVDQAFCPPSAKESPALLHLLLIAMKIK